ncbi:myelin transcription factor [Thalictrum thalictroides]|uniref:Myelin transcription factor n=1 Tax=Thalictrum thalictroides TaxID=46969 RepID=A0A7J6VYZ5_THATH|nr:myelin transcription factor [Thalictrum thalictroides]
MLSTERSKLEPKSIRKPLQPKNFNSNDENFQTKKKPNQRQKWFEITLVEDSNKENHGHPISSIVKKIEPFDSSLAEELNVIRKRLERLKLEKAKTETLLKKKDLVLEMGLKEIEKRGELQKKVEMETENVLRLKELRTFCLRTPAIQSLREREEEKKIKEAELMEKSKENEAETSESVD